MTQASLCGALELIRNARDIYVIGLWRAFPLAAYAFYGMVRSELRCHLLDGVGGMVPQQVATMGADDLLIAIAFAEYAPLTVDVVRDVHIRGIPTLAITDTAFSPFARHARLAFTIRDPDVHAYRSLAAGMCLVKTLIVALGRFQPGLAETSRGRGSE
ncbi:MAG: transcriptional regulator [Geminicoccaceae bacterium]|nr:transcriptional regulator [Microvirga sp.]MCE3248787.1 transcriptional regulator [Geminicoccaceae bacterium]